MTDVREALGERLFDGALQMAELMTVYLGDALGLYRTLHTEGPATVPELAERAGIAERYAQEWLESQAASGFIDVDDVTAEPSKRRYSLSVGHAEALTDPDSLYYAAPLAQLAGVGPMLPRLKEVFRTGDGIAWTDYGPEITRTQGAMNRPWLKSLLSSDYLPKVPDVHERLTSQPTRVADLACGVGWAGIAIAKAFPQAVVDGFDADAYSIELANKNAADAGVADRARFAVRDVGALADSGQYDLAVVIEAVHDLSRPVEFLATTRQMLKPDGVVIVADENTGETFTAPAEHLLDRLFYAASVLLCLPNGLAEQPSAATGTVIRPATMRRYATEAGFTTVTTLDEIEHDFFRFYRLEP